MQSYTLQAATSCNLIADDDDLQSQHSHNLQSQNSYDLSQDLASPPHTAPLDAPTVNEPEQGPALGQSMLESTAASEQMPVRPPPGLPAPATGPTFPPPGLPAPAPAQLALARGLIAPPPGLPALAPTPLALPPGLPVPPPGLSAPADLQPMFQSVDAEANPSVFAVESDCDGDMGRTYRPRGRRGGKNMSEGHRNKPCCNQRRLR